MTNNNNNSNRTNPSTAKSNQSPSGASRRIVDAVHNWGFLANMREEEVGSLRSGNRSRIQQRELVRAILQDQEQWEKLHHAMQQHRCCTSMSLTQNLHGLIQDRIVEMEQRRQRTMTSSPTNSS